MCVLERTSWSGEARQAAGPTVSVVALLHGLLPGGDGGGPWGAVVTTVTWNTHRHMGDVQTLPLRLLPDTLPGSVQSHDLTVPFIPLAP